MLRHSCPSNSTLRWLHHHDLWKDTLAPHQRKTSQNVKKFKLKDLPGWKDGGIETFEGRGERTDDPDRYNRVL